MSDMWVTILGQIPFVAVFVWYALEVSKQSREAQDRFLDALDKRDLSFEARTKSLIETMNVNNRAVLDTLARMETNDRTHNDLVREKLTSRSRSRAKADTE